MTTLCLQDGKTYILTSKIKKCYDGSFIADGKTTDGRYCLIRWFIPYPVDVNEPSDWDEADEVIILSGARRLSANANPKAIGRQSQH